MEVRHRSRRPAKLEGREPLKKKEDKPQVEQSPRVKAIMDIVRKEVVGTMNCRYFALTYNNSGQCCSPAQDCTRNRVRERYNTPVGVALALRG